ncbi:SMI1/KNR4 family protein [Flagellimonas meridianipacifica]|nr:SMI1/KNR4 family protein [Allomuricauda pacifica]
MQNRLYSQLENALPNGMVIPLELKLLYEWIEANGFYVDNDNGTRIGFLCRFKEFFGTSIDFEAQEKDVWYWFDENKDAEFRSRFCSFARSGDGSICGLWKSDNDEIKVVHIGSGSGSTLVCVLADNMIDFIKFLAIGYEEICWEEDFANPPNEKNPDFKPNVIFQEWVKDTFNVEIPKTALEIVKYPATMEDESSEDDFFNWCKSKFSFLE